ncbi:MAG: recombinase family protein [Clostridiales bacterium]|nr:recombinase family protein [Clostridiales bacterium]
MKEDRTIAIYSRKSKYTGKGESIGNQVDMAKEYISMHYPDETPDSVLVYEDEGFSGGNLNRPQFKQMMAEAKSGKIKTIIVYRLDRISRNVSDFSGLIEELNELDIDFVSIREQFDTATPMGRAMMYIASVFSQLERETIAERIRDNMHELAKTGRWLGGTTPTGYTSEAVEKVSVDGKMKKSCKLKLLPDEAAIIKIIFDLFLETKSLTRTETQLVCSGLKTKQGNFFSRYSIKTILTNPVYAIADTDMYQYLTDRDADLYSDKAEFDGKHALIAYYKTIQKKGKAYIHNPIDKWIIAVGKHEGIIEGKKWIAAQNELEKNKDKSFRRDRINKALLTGVIYCSCGARMVPRITNRDTPGGERVFTYRCALKEKSRGTECSRKNANGNILDMAVIEKIKGLNEDRDEFLKQIKRGKTMFSDHSRKTGNELDTLRKKLDGTEQKIVSLVDSIPEFHDKASRERIAERIGFLNEESEQIQIKIRDAEAAMACSEDSGMEFSMLEQMISSFAATVDEMNTDQKRMLVKSIVRNIIWDGKDAHIFLFGDPEEPTQKEFSASVAFSTHRLA